MLKKFKVILFAVIISTVAFLTVAPSTLNNVVHAANTPDHGNLLCQLLPFLDTETFGLNKICGKVSANGSTASQVASVVRFGVSLVFIGIILFAVITIIRAAIKYIQSEGNDTKIQEASKAIKAVFIGIGALFVGVIGLIIIVVFFQGQTSGTSLNNNDSNVPGLNQLNNP